MLHSFFYIIHLPLMVHAASSSLKLQVFKTTFTRLGKISHWRDSLPEFTIWLEVLVNMGKLLVWVPDAGFAGLVVFSVWLMYILQVSSEISTLRKSFTAEGTCKWPLSRMLSKVVSQIARLLEHRSAVSVHAFKVQLDPLSIWISHFNGLMPLSWNALKRLGSACLIAYDIAGVLVTDYVLKILVFNSRYNRRVIVMWLFW